MLLRNWIGRTNMWSTKQLYAQFARSHYHGTCAPRNVWQIQEFFSHHQKLYISTNSNPTFWVCIPRKIDIKHFCTFVEFIDSPTKIFIKSLDLLSMLVLNCRVNSPSYMGLPTSCVYKCVFMFHWPFIYKIFISFWCYLSCSERIHQMNTFPSNALFVHASHPSLIPIYGWRKNSF